MSKNMIQWLEIGDLDIHISDGNYSSKYPRSEEFIESGVPFIRANNLVNKSISDEEMYFISPQKHGLLKKGHLKTNDVLISTRGDLGKVALVPKRYNDSNINAQLVLLRPNPHKIDPLYLLYCFEGDRVKGQISQLQTGTALKQLPVGNLKRIKIPLPPLEEQRRIAAILDKADGVRRKRKEAIRLTEELLKSTFLEMFGDPVTNPKGWEIKKLEEVTTKITDGVHSRPNYTEQGVPFISVKDITTGELKFDDCKFISEEDHKKYKKRCNPDLGDILYTKVGATYGRPALVNVKSEFSLYVSVCLIKPQRDLIFPEFLKEALATPALKRQADRSIKGIGVPDLHLNMIKDFIVPVPPIYKQKEFLEIASKIQSSKESLTSCSQESENLFNSLLQRAFRGEL
ncbi:restriction endonuclease subunit S [Microcystis viridis]|uniref:Restriction endonuclease subunit S n=1 Tax=Microcystis viridis FACHB-1342 TaxID=2692900 RepID=A0ABR8G7T3_MICVR|nr:restriction endonuclease subunit S [Microcystis viridis]MBD2599293.1 restriction endonuclease subunit S [Microcystis viridis FACHB-1342]